METQLPQNNNTQKRKSKAVKVLFITLGCAAVAVGGFMAWNRFFRRPKNEEMDESLPAVDPTRFVSSAVPQPSYQAPRPQAPVAKTSNDDFPLKQKSKGENVRKLQNALIAKYGASVLPGGADEYFGPNTEKALTKNGWPAVIDENTFHAIVDIAKDKPETAAQKLIDAAKSKNFAAALASLKQIDSVDEYNTVNIWFKAKELNDVRTTLVTGMFNTFTTASQKDQLKQQFLRMGLKNKDGIWSLSGIDSQRQIITLYNTYVWDYPNKRIAVEGNTVLGTAIETRGGYTLFRTLDNLHQLLVKTTSIKNYE